MANRFLGTHFHQWLNGEKLKCNLRVGVNFFVRVNFVPGDNFPGGKLLLEKISSYRENHGGNLPGDNPGSFRSLGQLLTTLDTLLGRKFPREMSWNKLLLLYLLWYIFD